MNKQNTSNEGSPNNKPPSSNQPNNQKMLEHVIDLYLESNPLRRQDKKTNEIEIRFGTKPKQKKNTPPITKINYDNAVAQLYSSGFVCENVQGIHMLRIVTQYNDPKTGYTKSSNIRAEIVGIDLIKEYCSTNSLQKLLDMPSVLSANSDKLKFTQKTPAYDKENKMISKIDYDDFNFRVSYQLEYDYRYTSENVKNIIHAWSNSKKTFRHINRVRFYHSEYPIFADVSIVKSSKKTRNGIPIPEYEIREAGVFDKETIESYEIELEIDNSKVGTGTYYNTTDKIITVMKKCIRIILSGLQGTQYPISYSESTSVLQSYMKLIHGDEYSSEENNQITSYHFIGPNSYTLQKEHLIHKSDTNIPNIVKDYTVTDKADGDRKLLYISNDGRVYMIDTNMNVIFTGTHTTEKLIHNSLLDGEHIKFNKKGEFINLYAAFDVYYINKKSVREFSFMKTEDTPKEELDNKYRLLLLKKLVKMTKHVSVVQSANEAVKLSSCAFRIQCKEFYTHSSEITIFQCCSKILSDIKDGIYEYETDGLIFTPINPGVGSDKPGVAGPLHKITWEYSFKWKPEISNTIDFLVSVKKDTKGNDELHNIFENNQNLQGFQNVIQYKTIVLKCGFNEKTHGFLNPFQDIIEDNLPNQNVYDDNYKKLKPIPFQPTNPYDSNACLCNIIMVKNNGSSELVMKTEEEQYFEDDMIVEFRYDITKETGWRWIPLRVRYDKTSEYRSGVPNFGNAYHVANSNWMSLHNPITEEMISTGIGFSELSVDENVYYNRTTKETNTQSLRDFHNLYVKRKLIMGVSDRKNTLIDFAVGKAGDLSKWIDSHLSFVFGIDISKDNIHNHLDGACARFLVKRKKYGHNMPRALFVNGNSSLNIRSGEAFQVFTEKDKMISNSIFGNGPKDRKIIGEGVYKQYGIAQEGFNISSCQFALHYFFENITTIHQFVRNVSECTKLNGYFIGTCYDGKTVFDLLKNINESESIPYFQNGRKIFEITKKYFQSGFSDDETSLGYPIHVYQETINKVFTEYLVNFEYFTRIMENYGFVLLPKQNAEKMGFPNSSGLFNELYYSMQKEIDRNSYKLQEYGTASIMTPNEQNISFMNRYFIFQKTRNVSIENITKIINKSGQTQNITENDEANYEVNPEDDIIDYAKVTKNINKNTIIENKINVEIAKTQKKHGKKIINAKFIFDTYSPIVDLSNQKEEPEKINNVNINNDNPIIEKIEYMNKPSYQEESPIIPNTEVVYKTLKLKKNTNNKTKKQVKPPPL